MESDESEEMGSEDKCPVPLKDLLLFHKVRELCSDGVEDIRWAYTLDPVLQTTD